MVLCWAYAAVLRTWSSSEAFTLNVTVNDRACQVFRVSRCSSLMVDVAGQTSFRRPGKWMANTLSARFHP
jgi:hypothetical protein